MISFDEETRTLWVSERYNRDVSVFLVDGKPDHEIERKQPRDADFTLPESLLGAPVVRPFAVGPGRLAHPGDGPALKIFAFDERGFHGVKETAALPTDPLGMWFDTDLSTVLWSRRDTESNVVTYYLRKLERVTAR